MAVMLINNLFSILGSIGLSLRIDINALSGKGILATLGVFENLLCLHRVIGIIVLYLID